MKLFKYIFSLIILFSTLTVDAQTISVRPNQDAQDIKLAQQYYKNGEYEKALAIYEKLYQDNLGNDYYYRNYLNTLVALKELDLAEKLINEQIGRNRNKPSYYVDLGNIYNQKENESAAKEQFDKATKLITTNKNEARNVANTFTQIEEYDYAIAVYEQARTASGRPEMFLYELANVYAKKGDFKNTVDKYLEYSKHFPKNVQIVKNYFQRNFKDDQQYDILQKQLYKRIQQEPDQILYPELLIWLFTQKKDFENAIIQVKALDKRFKEDGNRVYKLGQSAITETQYEAAAEAFDYVIEKGPGKYYIPARSEALRANKLKITEKPDYTQEDIDDLEVRYAEFIQEFGRNANSAATMRDYALLKAFYQYDLNEAINILDEVVAMPTASKGLKAQAKLDLGDFYLMKNEVWEAVLLYSQVDKAMKDDILGELARFKNAKLSYYNGDFEWSQTQLSVLKASTTELISNDAIDLSVFITDHLGLDTTNTTMEMYARADLLFVQNKIDKALATLDSIERIYPGHALSDDILLQRSKIEMKRRNHDKAISYLNDLLEDFSEEILADNAIFMLGEIHQFHKKDLKKAMEYYQTLILDHTGSLFTVEARKRFRKLRGDLLN